MSSSDSNEPRPRSHTDDIEIRAADTRLRLSLKKVGSDEKPHTSHTKSPSFAHPELEMI